MEVGNIENPSNFKNIAGIEQEKTDYNKSFTELLSDSINEVNDLQHKSNQAKEDFALGETEDIHEVMIASQKARVSIDAAATISNKAVGAYEEIMRMQV